jgi:hypothetical protein
VLYFPSGVYRVISTRANFSGDQVADDAAVIFRGSNIIIQGEGCGSIIQIDGNPKGLEERPWTTAFYFDFGALNPSALYSASQYPEFETGGILIKDMTFRGNISPVQMANMPNASGYHGAGSPVALFGVPQRFARNIRFVNCTFEDTYKGTAISPGYVDDLTFENCTFTVLKNYINGIRVRAASLNNANLDDNEFMNLRHETPPDLWAEDYADGVGLNTGDRVLFLNQANSAENGIYQVDEDWNWQRAPDCRPDGQGLDIFIDQAVRAEEGTVNKFRIFQLQRSPRPAVFSGSTSTPKLFYEFVNVIGASTQNYNRSGTAPDGVDGSFPADGMLILLKDQTNPSENGIYQYNSTGPWKQLYAKNVIARVRQGNTYAFVDNVKVARYFRAEVNPTYVEMSASELSGIPIGFVRVRAASQSNIDVTTAQSIDGVNLASGDIVLLTGQDAPKTNGLYKFNGSSLVSIFFGYTGAAEVPEFFLAGLHITVAEGATLKGQHFANRNPLKINLSSLDGNTFLRAIIFNRAHNFVWSAAAVSADGETVGPLSGLKTVGGYALQSGDLVLLRSQSDTSENGLYIAQRGQWRRALGDPGPTAAVGEFNVIAWADPSGRDIWIRSNGIPPEQPTINTYSQAAERSRPQIISTYANGTIKVIGCSCDCDYIGSGREWGCDGLFWFLENGSRAYFFGNEITNFRFEAIQSAAIVTEVVNNRFYSRMGRSPIAVNMKAGEKDPPENAVFSALVANNDLENCWLYYFPPNYYPANSAEIKVDVDTVITGNTARNGGAIGINHGRRVTIANNQIQAPFPICLTFSSCTRGLSVVRRAGVSTIELSWLNSGQVQAPGIGRLQTGDKVVFWVARPADLPAPLNCTTTYFVKVESATTVSLYSNAALTAPVLITQEFSAGTILYYDLDTSISITGNTFLDVAQTYSLQGGSGDPTNQTTPYAYTAFSKIVISNNIIGSSLNHINTVPPLAGVQMISIANNLLLDSANNPWTGSYSVIPFAYSTTAGGQTLQRGQVILQTDVNPANLQNNGFTPVPPWPAATNWQSSLWQFTT